MVKSLNLDSEFHPTQYSPIPFNSFVFKGGETHIQFKTIDLYETEEIVITHRITKSDNIIQIMLAKDALERMGIKKFKLIIPYLPYARQDRPCNEGEPLSIKVFANLINSMNFDRVIVYDAHSDVSLALINNISNQGNDFLVINAFKTIKERPHLIFPDSGASKKYNKLTDLFRDAKYSITCSKHRDTKNGVLSNFKIDTPPIKDNPCLIIDDICDGGRTFIGIAKELKLCGAGDIYLCVTHGIFSNGTDELSQWFKHVFCSDSFSTLPYSNFIKQFNIQTSC